MLRGVAVETIHEQGDATIDSVVLEFDQRFRRRIVLKGEHGLSFLLDLERAVHLRDGDAIVLEDGRRIAVVAAPEPLAEIRCRDRVLLARVAWHVGNRHQAVMIDSERLLIRRDPVIERMVEWLGGIVRHVDAPFDPEGGAYADADQHRHG